MKVALVHDYLKEYGGAERVLETLSEIYPDAPIYTSVYLPEFLGPHRKRFEKKNIKTTWLQNVPFKHKLISPFRLLAPFAFQSLDLSKFDVIIVSQTGAYFPNFVKKSPSASSGLKKAKLICYTHTPPRYLYGYMTAREWKKNIIFRVLAETANHFLRMADYAASKQVDYFLSNSEEVKARIAKFYRREATVINPPVDVSHKTNKKEEYYLTGGRLARAKGTDIVIEAFNKMGKPLKIFGRGFAGFEEELKAKAKDNIEFVGEVDDEAKFELMSKARAFIFSSFDEDFGIVPVESQSVGTSVIAYKSGGVKETVIDGKTGVFYDENIPEKIIEAVKRFEKSNVKSSDCVEHAKKFSKETFVKKIEDFIKEVT